MNKPAAKTPAKKMPFGFQKGKSGEMPPMKKGGAKPPMAKGGKGKC